MRYVQNCELQPYASHSIKKGQQPYQSTGVVHLQPPPNVQHVKAMNLSLRDESDEEDLNTDDALETARSPPPLTPIWTTPQEQNSYLQGIPPQMSVKKKKLLFIRHGEAYHNSLYAAGNKHNALQVRDPVLTDAGHQQVLSLRKNVNEMVKDGLDIDIILVSPLTRTLQTAYGAFYDQPLRMEACSLVTELCDAKCNEGTAKSKLQHFWYFVDFTTIPEYWWPEHESRYELMDRVAMFKKWLKYRPEETIAIVSHGGFLYALLRIYFYNCEARCIDWAAS